MAYKRRRTVTGAWTKTGTPRRVRRVSVSRKQSPKRYPKSTWDIFSMQWLFGNRRTYKRKFR